MNYALANIIMMTMAILQTTPQRCDYLLYESKTNLKRFKRKPVYNNYTL